MILKNPINYREGIINIEIELVIIRIKRRTIIINFDILPLRNDEAILGML